MNLHVNFRLVLGSCCRVAPGVAVDVDEREQLALLSFSLRAGHVVRGGRCLKQLEGPLTVRTKWPLEGIWIIYSIGGCHGISIWLQFWGCVS